MFSAFFVLPKEIVNDVLVKLSISKDHSIKKLWTHSTFSVRNGRVIIMQGAYAQAELALEFFLLYLLSIAERCEQRAKILFRTFIS